MSSEYPPPPRYVNASRRDFLSYTTPIQPQFLQTHPGVLRYYRKIWLASNVFISRLVREMKLSVAKAGEGEICLKT